MRYKIWTSIAGAVGLLLLILDSKTAVFGAREALSLCLLTVIPTLFPFFLCSILLTSGLGGVRLSVLRPLGRFLRIPRGSEHMFLVGALGGYPTGAQSVTDGYCNGQLSKQEARRMLGFCSNAGPSFLFGIAGLCFTSPVCPWLLWLIHLVSALLTGFILPGGSQNTCRFSGGTTVTLPEALKRSLRITAQVCGWIIIFRVVLAFLQRWFLWMLAPQDQIFLHGVLELTIGCFSLTQLQCEGLRFILCAGFLAFGGLCVTMQTLSVTAPIGLGMYLPGKFLQTLISLFLAGFIQEFVFSGELQFYPGLSFYLILPIIGGIFLFFLYKREKSSSIWKLNRV